MTLQTILCSLWIWGFLVNSLKGLELNFFSFESKENREGWFVLVNSIMKKSLFEQFLKTILKSGETGKFHFITWHFRKIEEFFYLRLFDTLRMIHTRRKSCMYTEVDTNNELKLNDNRPILIRSAKIVLTWLSFIFYIFLFWHPVQSEVGICGVVWCRIVLGLLGEVHFIVTEYVSWQI